MSLLDNIDIDQQPQQNYGKKYFNGLQNLGDEMARVAFSKNPQENFDELNLLFTLKDFYKENDNKKSSVRSSYNRNKNNSEYFNEYSKRGLPKIKKKKKKFESFSKISFFSINKNKNLNGNKPNKSNNNIIEIKNENPNKNNSPKNYVKFNCKRISVISPNNANLIKHTNTIPKKDYLFKFINKDKDNKNIIKFNNKINNYSPKRKNDDNINKKATISNNDKYNNNFNNNNIEKNGISIQNINSLEDDSFTDDSQSKIPIQSIKTLTKNEKNINGNNNIDNNRNLNINQNSPKRDIFNIDPNRISIQNKKLNNDKYKNYINNSISSKNNNRKRTTDSDSKKTLSNEEEDNNNINIKNYNYINKNNGNDINNINNNFNKNNNSNGNSWTKNYTNNNGNNKNSSSNELENFEIEIIKPENIDKSLKSSNASLNGTLIHNNYKKYKGKKPKDHLYYLGMNNLRKKERKLNKERELIIEKKLSQLQDRPQLNEYTNNIIERKKEKNEYIPIQERAAEIHSRKLTRIILHENKIKLEKENEEKKDLEIIKLYKSKKLYDPNEWDEFVQSQNRWKDEVNYKRKAAEILEYQKYNHKPKISFNSRNIINELSKKNVSVDDVWKRLYNDFDERKERQKVIDKNYTPSFKPRHGNKNYIKFINKKKAKKKNHELLVTNYDKNNYFLDSQISINGGYIYPYNSRNSVNNRNRCKYCYFKKQNLKNSKKSLTADNSTIFVNKSTNENTIGYFSKVANVEPNLITESYISNYNNNNYPNSIGINQSFDNNIYQSGRKNKNIIRLNKNLSPYYLSRRNNYNNYPIYNQTINITCNKNDNFFNIENIEDL